MRLTPPASPRDAILADVRAVVPDLPRGADAAQVVRRAHRLVLDAAVDEFAREGTELVDLPDGWGRAELLAADVAADPAVRAVFDQVVASLVIAPSTLARDDALALRDGDYAADAYGFSLETAADLASYLLSRAWAMAPAGTEEDFLARQAELLRGAVRDRLERLVRVPLELRTAIARHEQVESSALAARHPAPAEPAERLDPAALRVARQELSRAAATLWRLRRRS